MIHNILIPTDFSPASWQATKLGIELASANDSALHLLHILPTASRYDPRSKHLQLPHRLESVKAKMNEIADGLNHSRSVVIENHVLLGNIANTLMDFVKAHAYDLIVLGVNSNGFNNEPGSHTSMLLKDSNIPILVVPNANISKDALAS